MTNLFAQAFDDIRRFKYTPWWMPAIDKLNPMRVFRIGFNPHDIWVGVFWSVVAYADVVTKFTGKRHLVQIYICIVPCCPIRIAWSTRR